MTVLTLTKKQVVDGLKELLDDIKDNPINTPSEAVRKGFYLLRHVETRKLQDRVLGDAHDDESCRFFDFLDPECHWTPRQDSSYFEPELSSMCADYKRLIGNAKFDVKHNHGDPDVVDYWAKQYKREAHALRIVKKHPTAVYLENVDNEGKTRVVNYHDATLMLRRGIGLITTNMWTYMDYSTVEDIRNARANC